MSCRVNLAAALTRSAVALIAVAGFLSSGCAEPVNLSGRIPPGPFDAKRGPLPLALGVTPLPISTAQVCTGSSKPVAARSTRSNGILAFVGSSLGVPPLFAQWTTADPNPHRSKDGGDAHFTTLNNLHYDFQGVGEFVALRSADGAFEVQTRLQPFGISRSVSVNTAIAMNVAGDRVGVYARPAHQLLINGSSVELRATTFALNHGGRIEIQGNEFVVTWPVGSQVRVIYGPYLDFVTTLCAPHLQSIRGLLGEDLTADAPLTARDGRVVHLTGSTEFDYNELYHVLGDSWRVHQRTSLFDYDTGQNTATFTDRQFPYPADSSAHVSRNIAEQVCNVAGLSTPPALNDCIADVSSTGSGDFADNDAFLQSLFEKSIRAQVGTGNFECQGPEGTAGWRCKVANLIGAQFGSTMTLSLETLVDGKRTVESLSCGPVTASFEAACSGPTRGRNFQNSTAIERYTLKSGEIWEIRSSGVCSPAKNPGEPC